MTSRSLGVLVDDMANWLAARGERDPFAFDVVCTPDPGTQRWVAGQLARRLGTTPGEGDGICAGVEFVTLPRFLRELGGAWVIDTADLVHPVLNVLDAAHDETWLTPVVAHLAPPTDGLHPGRRFSIASRVAHLLARYARLRPDLLAAWERGEDDVPADVAWQPELWRRVRALIVAAPRESEREIPARLAIIDPPALSSRWRSQLVAIGERAAVTVWLPVASPVLARRLADAPPVGLRAHEERLAQHRLNARLGRKGNEVVRTWASLGWPTRELHSPEPTASLLGWLQADVAADQPPVDEPTARKQRPLHTSDRSIEVHLSHGPDRQVGVLRDVLLRRFADDPTLEPRDVVIFCPQIERYAPLLTAAFGLRAIGHPHPGHRLRVQVQDRSLSQANPVLATLGLLFDLATSRASATELLDLAAHPPIARTLLLREDDHKRLTKLVTLAGVRWGIDSTHRKQFGLAGFPQNTWAAGLDRMLLGVAMSDEDLATLGTVLPLDEVTSEDAALIGRLTVLLSNVRAILQEFATPRPLCAWLDVCREALTRLCTVGPADTWQMAHAHTTLADLAETAPVDGPVLGLGDLRLALAEILRGRAPRSTFGNGSLVVTTFGQLTHVPHRLVCLLGLDDGVFPRVTEVDGDDLLQRKPAVGDPDVRASDRQYLLDALLAAQEALIVVAQGADPASGAAVPTVVPLTELLDAVTETSAAKPADVRAHVLRRHRLQPFAPENFTGPERSFDQLSLEGAKALCTPRVEPEPRLPTDALPLPYAVSALTLKQLGEFLKDPVKIFLRERAQLRMASRDEVDVDLPIDLGPLERWNVGERFVEKLLAGHDPETVLHAEWLRGTIPPRVWGNQTLEGIRNTAVQIAKTAAPLQQTPPVDHDVDLEVDGLRLTGLVRTRGHDIVTVGFGNSSASKRVQGWLELCALTAAEPGQWRWVYVGPHGIESLGEISKSEATCGLSLTVSLYRQGMQSPLPLALRCAERYARMAPTLAPGYPLNWEKIFKKEWSYDAKPPLTDVYPTITALVADVPHADDPGWVHEATRFGQLARALFDPIIAAEENR